MSEPLPVLIEDSIQIAWDYLERSGDLRDPQVASRVLLNSIESMVRVGEKRRLMLSNRAINAYKKYRAERIRLEVVAGPPLQNLFRHRFVSENTDRACVSKTRCQRGNAVR